MFGQVGRHRVSGMGKLRRTSTLKQDSSVDRDKCCIIGVVCNQALDSLQESDGKWAFVFWSTHCRRSVK